MKYVPGAWICVVVPGAAAVIEPGPSVKALDGIVEGLRLRGIGGLLDALGEASLEVARPPLAFAAAVLEGASVQVAVRGGAAAHETRGDSARKLSELQGDALQEQWEAVHELRLVAAGADPGAEGMLWIEGGIVFAGCVDVDVAAQAERALAPSLGGKAPETEDSMADAAPFETMIPELTESVRLSAPPAASPAEPTGSVEDEEWDSTISINQYRKNVLAQQALDSQSDPVPATPLPAAPALGTPVPSTPAPPGPPVDGLIDGVPDTVRVPSSTGPLSSGPVVTPALGDHDGATVSVAEMLALQGAVPSAPVQTGTGSFSQRRRGRARISTGQVVEIDRTIIIGRLPRASRVTGQPPELIAVPSPQQDISRNHVEIRLEGSAVVVVDLNTTNGTVLQRVGADAVRLHPGEPSVVTDGDVIDLGDNVTVAFEGIG